MKPFVRTAGKTLIVVCACAVVIFLLLPFLETQAPQTKDAQKASPQIFTSNPLTELVSRIASFFRGDKASASARNRHALTARQTEQQFGVAQYGPVYASAHGEKVLPQPTDDDAEDSKRFDYGDALLQNEEGEWVLVRQTAPSGGAQGMHEVNVTDNAYDRYVRQERAARFTPAPANRRQEVPDSKWAKMFRPIKKLFGAADQTPAAGGLRIQNDDAQKGGYLASSQGIGKNRSKQGSSFERPSLDEIYNFTPGANSSLPVATESPFQMILNPQSMFEKNANAFADQVFPDPKTSEEKKAKEKLKAQIQQKQDIAFRRELDARLNNDLQNAQQKDLLPETMNCNKPAALYSEGGCNAQNTAPAPSEESIQAQQQKSWEKLEQRLKVQIPSDSRNQVKMMVVLEKKAPETDKNLQEFIEDNVEGKPDKFKEAYHELYTQILAKCQNKDCFWVAKYPQVLEDVKEDPSVKDSVTASGFQFAPSNTTGGYENALQQFRDALMTGDLLDDMSLTEDEELELLRLINTPQTPLYLPMTGEELKEIYDSNKSFSPNDPDSSLTAFYAMTPNVARDINNAVGGPYATFYDATRQQQGSGMFSADQFPGAVQAGETISQNVLDRFDLFMNMNKQISQDLINSYTKDHLKAEVDKIKEDAQQNIPVNQRRK